MGGVEVVVCVCVCVVVGWWWGGVCVCVFGGGGGVCGYFVKRASPKKQFCRYISLLFVCFVVYTFLYNILVLYILCMFCIF